MTAVMFSMYVNSQDIELAPLFTNNMVFQQLSQARVWGIAPPGERISVTASWGAQAEAQADEKGRWTTSIKTVAAGGPHTLKVRGAKAEILLSNVLMGEVWVCSGQSNMEMPLKGWPPNDTIEHSAPAIASATIPTLRFFTVQRSYSLTTETRCTGSWVEATPQSAAEFSATAFFFGRALSRELAVPIGLINASWGGTASEAWTSAEALGRYPDFSSLVANLGDLNNEQRAYDKWLKTHRSIDVSSRPDSVMWKKLDFDDQLCAMPQTSDSAWPSMVLPGGMETTIGEFDGAVWFRTWVDVPATLAGSELTVVLPGVDDMDQVWVNGVMVGATEVPGFWQMPREYIIPKGLVKTGDNLVAIRIVDTQGGGGIWNSQLPMEIRSANKNTESVSLKKTWKYLIVSEYRSPRFYVFDAATLEGLKRPVMSQSVGQNTPSVLFNAMINPLIPYSIKGVVWYQGETNVGRAKQYQDIFPLMMESWREAWGLGSFPFYFVQICPWDYGDNSSGAELRDAQRKTLRMVEHTGMVVTLDIGLPHNIHPPKKQEVGERLALWALKNDYGKNVMCSGPLYARKTIDANQIIVEFDYAQSGLKLVDANNNQFEIAGDDGVFVPARVKLMQNKAYISSPAVTRPAKVRYAFRNTSHATLFNSEGLPASSFETE